MFMFGKAQMVILVFIELQIYEQKVHEFMDYKKMKMNDGLIQKKPLKRPCQILQRNETLSRLLGENYMKKS